MVVKDGKKWRRVNSRKIRGHWYGFRDAPEDEELDNMPDIFITIDGKVPKNMSGEGTDEFELWPVKHYGSYRHSGYRYIDYSNSYGYYYSIKQYTYWDGILHSRTDYFHHDSHVEYIEGRMAELCENHAKETPDEYDCRPFFIPDDERFVKARYTIKQP